MAVGRLHGVSGVAIHGPVDHGGPVLFGENSRQVPGVADQGKSHVDGGANVDHPGAVVLHQHIRLGALRRVPGPVARTVRRPVPQGPGVQHGADHRLLLDHAHRAVRAVRRYLQGGVRDAEEERGETAQDAINGGAERGHGVGHGWPRGRYRHVQDAKHAVGAGQTATATATPPAAAAATTTPAATPAATATKSTASTAAAPAAAAPGEQVVRRSGRERERLVGRPRRNETIERVGRPTERGRRRYRGGGGQRTVEQSGVRVGRGEHHRREQTAADQLAAQKIGGRTHCPVGAGATVEQRHPSVAVRQSHTVQHVRQQQQQ